ncbi:MAG TPA: hypothetical protein VGC22_06565 [Chitinophaga sp.]
MFAQLGLKNIQRIPANEVYRKGDHHFEEKAGIWTKVAERRGPQMVKDNYITETERLQAIEAYQAWVAHEAEWMILKLNDTQGSL